MRKKDTNLFQIGEVVKILGVSRKMILNYEALGLLTAAYKDEASGYRYYTADNMAQIRSIRSLQSLGLSLREVGEYYYDTTNIDSHLQRLMELRATLDRNIRMVQVRTAQAGDLTVHQVTLPRQVCYCRRYRCKDTAEAAVSLRETYLAAARSGFMSIEGRMFTERVAEEPGALDLLCCIPAEDGFDGPERTEFPEKQAVCIYYRGPYEGMTSVHQALMQYVEANQIRATGGFRSIYLEGPPNHGGNSEAYITQVALPVAEERYGK